MLDLGGVAITHEDDSPKRTIYNPGFGILMAEVWGHGSSFKPTLPYMGWCIYPDNDISNSCNENNIILYIYIYMWNNTQQKKIKKPKGGLLFHSNVTALFGNRQIRPTGEILSRLRRRGRVNAASFRHSRV